MVGLLDGTGYNWFSGKEAEMAGALSRLGAGKPTAEMREVDRRVSELVKRLAALDYARSWAMIIAVQWFWEHCQDPIDPRRDPWWTLPFRMREADEPMIRKEKK